MNPHPALRLVLPDDLALRDVELLARRHLWLPEQRFERSAEAPLEVVWSAPDGETTVHFIDDYLLGVRYVALDGPHAHDVAASITAAMPIESSSTLLEHEPTDPAARRRWAGKLALCASADDPAPVLVALRQLLRDKDESVRRAAVLAVGYLGDAAVTLERDLEERARSDRAPAVRSDAARMRRSIREAAAR